MNTQKKETQTLNDEDLLKLLPHQEQVNLEIFKAVEILGHKLERVEKERNHLAQRLALIESAATVDERTGKLYLPVAVQPGAKLPTRIVERTAPKWTVAASLTSSALALAALTVVVFQPTVAPVQLTDVQMAALDAITKSHVARLESRAWQPLEEDYGIDIARLPDPSTLMQEEFQAEEAEDAPTVLTDVDPEIYSIEADIFNDIEPATGIETDIVAMPVEEESTRVAESSTLTISTLAPSEEMTKPPAVKAVKKEVVSVPPQEIVKTETPEPSPEPELQVAEKQAPVVIKTQPPKRKKELVKTVQAPVTTKTGTTAAPSAFGVIAPDTNLPKKLAALETKAFNGASEAQHDLATVYAAGELVAQDYKRAAYWFGRASESGIGNADYNLGVMFQQGMGVKQDLKKAVGWYTRAAEQDHPEALYNLGIAYIEGVGAKRNIEKGINYFKRAANTGVSQAAFNLGILYESGFTGSIDLEGAAEWYQLASNEGHSEARAAVERVKGQLLADIKDYGLELADKVEPASGQGDATPLDEEGRAEPPSFNNELVAEIQQALVKRGLLPQGQTNGILDSRTEDAIRAWQGMTGMTRDGRPTRAILQSLTGK